MRTDPEIRLVLIETLRVMYSGAIIVQEWRIGRSRADVAVICPDGIHGFEIKSAVDSTTRLACQVPDYDKVFTSCTLVAAQKHVSRVRDEIPEHWGIWVVEEAITPLRMTATNLLAVPAKLLWVAELREILLARALHLNAALRQQEKGARKGARHHARPTKATLVETLRDGVPRVEQARLVCETLIARKNWRTVDGKSILAENFRAEKRARDVARENKKKRSQALLEAIARFDTART